MRFITTIVICFLIVLSAGMATAQSLGGIVATVNDAAITQIDLDARTDLALSASNLPDNPDVRRRLQRQILQQLVNETLQLQEAEKFDITVSDDQINGAKADLARQNGIRPDELEQLLGDDPLIRDSLRDQLRAQIAWGKLVRLRLRPKIKVGENDIDQTIKQRAANAGENEYLLAEIYLPIDRSAERKSVMAQAQQLVDELLNGAPFQAIATQFSRGPTANQGGDIGWNRADQLNDRLADTVKQMKVGSLSKPIPTRDGVYILALRDKREIRPYSAGQTLVTLSQLVLPLPDDVTDQQIVDQQQRAQKIAGLVTSCDQLESVGKRISPGDSGPLGQLKLSELSPAIAGAIDGLNAGQISNPIRRSLPGGDGWVLIMVCDKQTGDMEAVRTQIANRIGNDRFNRLQAQYLRDLRQSAFIDIRYPSK